MNLFRAIPQWLAGQLSEYVDNVDFDSLRVRVVTVLVSAVFFSLNIFDLFSGPAIYFSEYRRSSGILWAKAICNKR